MTHTQANEPGFVLVPREPTEAMLDAYWEQSGESREMRGRTHSSAKRYFASMLGAAPIVPAPAYGVKADEIAKLVWEAMKWGVGAARPYHGFPDWMEGGNSLAQEKARDFERRILSCLSSAPVEEADAKAGEPTRDIIRSIQEGFAVALTPPAPTIPSEPKAKGEAGAGPVGEAAAWADREQLAALAKDPEAGGIMYGRQVNDEVPLYLHPVEEPGELERLTRERDEAREQYENKERYWINHANGITERANIAEAALAETRERLEQMTTERDNALAAAKMLTGSLSSAHAETRKILEKIDAQEVGR